MKIGALQEICFRVRDPLKLRRNGLTKRQKWLFGINLLPTKSLFDRNITKDFFITKGPVSEQKVMLNL